MKALPPFYLVKNVVELTEEKLASASKIGLGQPNVFTPYASSMFDEQREASKR